MRRGSEFQQLHEESHHRHHRHERHKSTAKIPRQPITKRYNGLSKSVAAGISGLVDAFLFFFFLVIALLKFLYIFLVLYVQAFFTTKRTLPPTTY